MQSEVRSLVLRDHTFNILSDICTSMNIGIDDLLTSIIEEYVEDYLDYQKCVQLESDPEETAYEITHNDFKKELGF